MASPPLVVAYALVGKVDFDFETEPLGQDQSGKDVFLRDIWPSRDQVTKVTGEVVTPDMFKSNYSTITLGNKAWQGLDAGEGKLYEWDKESTYINNPPFFQTMNDDLPVIKDIESAYCLLNMGDSITTDHISPAGKISTDSPAAEYLRNRGVKEVDFNTYGSRRGNDEIMARGTFANIRLINKMASKTGPYAVNVETGEEKAVFDVANEYLANGADMILLAGKEYGSGSSRDWAAKGPQLQGVKGVIAESFERIHRSNLVGMGILPMQFKNGENADSLGLTGKERFSIKLNGGNLGVHQDIDVVTEGGKSFTVQVRLDTEPEIEYFKNGGILHYVLRNLKNKK